MIEDFLFILRKLDPWHIIASILLSLVWLAILEGLIKPLIAYQTQRLARKVLPIVFDKLDPIMPSMIAQMTPEQIEDKIFNEFLGLGLTEAQAAAMSREFDRRFSLLEAARKRISYFGEIADKEDEA
jgi:hypothetical protein